MENRKEGGMLRKSEDKTIPLEIIYGTIQSSCKETESSIVKDRRGHLQ